MLIGQSCVLVGKWPRADRYFVLWAWQGEELICNHLLDNNYVQVMICERRLTILQMELMTILDIYRYASIL